MSEIVRLRANSKKLLGRYFLADWDLEDTNIPKEKMIDAISEAFDRVKRHRNKRAAAAFNFAISCASKLLDRLGSGAGRNFTTVGRDEILNYLQFDLFLHAEVLLGN